MRYNFSRLIFLVILLMIVTSCIGSEVAKVGTFQQEEREFYKVENGLPSNHVYSIAIANEVIYAATDKGLALFSKDNWKTIRELEKQTVWGLALQKNKVAAYVSGGTESTDIIYVLQDNRIKQRINVPESLKLKAAEGDLAFNGQSLLLGTDSGIYSINLNDVSSRGKDASSLFKSLDGVETIRQIAVGPKGQIVVAAGSGLFRFEASTKKWIRLFPGDGQYSWAPNDVRGVVFDSKGRLWFASPQGTGYLEGSKWTLFTGHEGLPYNDFTSMAAGPQGEVWFGTKKGAIRYDGKHWAYRQGLRWVPEDKINNIEVDGNGNAWFATSEGVGVITRRSTTLAEKAKFYEDQIDKYHRRTPYEFVLEVGLQSPADKTNVLRHDSDNDGLWTSMYGAGECFAYAATKDPKARARAKKVFEAMRFLGTVTQGAKHSPPPGFVARTVLPTSGPDPNIGRIEGDIRKRAGDDKMWKVYEPRWPVSADGKWFWKTDTSSDELDGHYFLYGLYYDLVAETEQEKEEVRKHVRALTDHLIKHGFNLVDHDGKPTRWSRFSPEELNYSKNWFVERGLNSLSMLSYLTVTEHITGDPKYGKIKDDLIENHSYMQNMMKQKFHHGTGTGNQSDDEMAFMAYYNLIKYEKDEERKSRYAVSFWDSWQLEAPEMNPFFNFTFAAVCNGITFEDAFGTYMVKPLGNWQEEAVETLKRFPLDRVNWRHTNSQRIDIMRLHPANSAFDEDNFSNKGYRVNGKVIPVDECYFNHYNYDPWRLDTGGNGRGMGCGTVFLLPYYMGLYHGFIEE